MNVEITTKSDFIIITIEGSIDSKTAQEIQEKIMVKISETNKVMLVLSEVNFVSSAGLRLLLMIYRQIKSKSGKVILVDVKDDVKDVMAMTGFVNFFEFAESIEDALKK